MTLALLFWVVYIVAVIVSLYRNYNDRLFIANNVVYWILLAILGIGIFGNPIK